MVVNLEVLLQRCLGFVKALIIAQVDFLVFDRSPQSFSKDVVKASAASVHADLNVRIFPQLANVFEAGKLAALIRVMNLRLSNS